MNDIATKESSNSRIKAQRKYRQKRSYTPQEIAEVYCDPAELTGFIHYPYSATGTYFQTHAHIDE